jgi:uncharacterized protein Smg (DUF494 family)
MKDSLFDLLLDLFERTIAQLKESYPQATTDDTSDAKQNDASDLLVIPGKKATVQMAMVQTASEKSFRVFTTDERMRLTKASYQLLHRLTTWGVVPADAMELILNRLMFSDVHIIHLSEVKWAVRNTMATSLDAEQLAFLDLVLYQKEHGFSLN